MVAGAVILAAGGIWFFAARTQDSERSSKPNTTPTFGLFVNDSRCADCHADQAAGHRATGHARTFHASVDSLAAAALDGRMFADQQRGYSYHYHFDPADGLSATIPEHFGDDRFPLPFAIGSGQNAVSFLTLIPNRFGDTVGIEHRMTMYDGNNGWELDLTPGHFDESPQQEVEHWGRVIRGDTLIQCVECHTTGGEIRGETIANLRPGVGCQSCHGPGREHVLAVEKGRVGGYAGLSEQSAREEIEMCGRCHRLPTTGTDAGVSPDDVRIVRFQSVGLLQSQCFQRSGESLGCTDCHDPHRPVVRQAAHYELRCRQCHEQTSLAHCPISPQTGCIDCHMPPIDVHRGIEFHDHWIRVRID